MFFNSLEFMIFFPTVILIYYLIPGKMRYIWLLMASYVFYMCWNVKYAGLLFFSTLITYSVAILMEMLDKYVTKYERNKLLRKSCLALGFLMNLSILFLFKYFNFTLRSMNTLLEWIGIEAIPETFRLVLPGGYFFLCFSGAWIYNGCLPRRY